MANDVMEMMNQAALNISAVSKQMGLIVGNLNEIKAEQNNMTVRMDTLESRMLGYEDRERLNRDQQRRLRSAIHARVDHVLGIEFSGGLVKKEHMSIDKKYRSAFFKKIYGDARQYSQLGTPYQETYVKDYDAVINYIENWEPECEYEGKTGTRAYIHYLNDRKSA